MGRKNSMPKIINASDAYVDEVLEGLCLAHPDLKIVGDERRVITRSKPPQSEKVGIVSGGGSGHLPLFCGYVGDGLLDACSIGNVFEGPTVGSCADAIREADRGKGVLCLFGNYGGDRMNFEMATEMVEMDGIQSSIVLGTDDVASATEEERTKRRGVAGLILAYKCAGAAADAGTDLDEVSRIAEKTVDRTRTIGFATAPCELPGAEGPSFEISQGQLEFGMGIHGEPGIWRAPMKLADAITDEMMDHLLRERPDSGDGEVAVLVNSLGATPFEELFIIYRRVSQILTQHMLRPAFRFVGPYVTSMEMAGASVSICFLDDELADLMGRPAACPFWKV